MNKYQKAKLTQEKLAKWKGVRNSIDFAMNFMQAYLETALNEPKNEAEELYKDKINQAIVDLDDARQLYDYLLGENKRYD